MDKFKFSKNGIINVIRSKSSRITGSFNLRWTRRWVSYSLQLPFYQFETKTYRRVIYLIYIRDLKKAQKADKEIKVESEEKIDKSSENFLFNKIEIIKFTIKLIKKYGFFSLYDGMTSSVFGSVLQNAIYFCSSKFWSYLLDHLDIKMGNLSRSMLINLISATCTAIITNPIWVVNARMAKKHKSVI